ncbi:MAG: hypothetical protein ACI9TH_001789, partial [Kiritimatiellia bacterium]
MTLEEGLRVGCLVIKLLYPLPPDTSAICMHRHA